MRFSVQEIYRKLKLHNSTSQYLHESRIEMNLSLVPIYGKTFIARKMRMAALWINAFADRLESVSFLTCAQRKVLLRNLQFRDKHKGMPAYVIVNGPSLASQDLTGLGNKILSFISSFPLNFY